MPSKETLPQLDHSQLSQHVRQLVRNSQINELASLGTAQTIERAITEYYSNASKNVLPEGMDYLNDLPSIFKKISQIIRSDSPNSEKESSLLAEILALRETIDKLEKELKLAKEKSINGRFKIKAIEAFGSTIGSPWFIGALGLGTAHFLGVSSGEITLNNLLE